MQHVLGRWRPVGVIGCVILAQMSCSGATEPDAVDGSSARDRVSEVLEAADRRWAPDLDDDGIADVLALTGNELHFVLQTPNGYVPVVDDQREELIAVVGDGVTVTCQQDGVYVQTLERPQDEANTGPLRLSRLDLDDEVGRWTPNPSFFFGPDFELPPLGTGCPDSE